jgi:hypothetical protein
MRVLIGIFATTALCGAPFSVCLAAGFASSEHGMFLLHDEERVAGKVTYDISSDGAGVKVTVDFNFADPLTDIRNTRNVTAVIANGKLFDPSVLWRSVGFKPWERH